MTQPEVIVIIPCYNEESRLSQDSFLSFVDHQPGFNFLFVNDGSTDQTAEMLTKLVSQRPERFSLLQLEKNSGKAEAVRRGFLSAMGSGVPYLAFWDADLATPLEVLPYFVKAFKEEPKVEIVLGTRVKLMGRQIERRPIRFFLGRIFAFFSSLVLNLAVYDTQCGAKMFRVTDALRAIFQKPFISRWIFDTEILARYLKKLELNRSEAEKYIYELPLKKWKEIGGSKVKPGDFIKAAVELLKIYSDNR